mgnify:CR=1 FL=1
MIRFLPVIASLLAAPALASSVSLTLDCRFTTECSVAEGLCHESEEALLSFAVIIAQEGDSARYEGDGASEPMAAHYTDEGVLILYDRAGSTLTSVGTDGTAVHASNLILVGHVNRAAQWSGTCLPR